MTDKVSAADRSRMMAAVRGKNTKPELAVRSALFAAGYRFRLHRRDLAGSPDIVLPRYRLAVFVHGCFWHGHDCTRGRRPASNVEFWNAKLDRNRARDCASRVALEAAGWTVAVIWQCSVAQQIERLLQELADRAHARRVTEVSELER
ncbi:MAG: very short patch repair endonuclease [Patescibacteria group bacterium]|nr:very short patch repair endonuclease [Patescibacteria group bacterium]